MAKNHRSGRAASDRPRRGRVRDAARNAPALPGDGFARLQHGIRLGFLGGVQNAAYAAGRDRCDCGVGACVSDHRETAIVPRDGQRYVAVAHVGYELQVRGNVFEMRPLRRT
jgi:hypothetical protein